MNIKIGRERKRTLAITREHGGKYKLIQANSREHKRANSMSIFDHTPAAC